MTPVFVTPIVDIPPQIWQPPATCAWTALINTGTGSVIFIRWSVVLFARDAHADNVRFLNAKVRVGILNGLLAFLGYHEIKGVDNA